MGSFTVRPDGTTTLVSTSVDGSIVGAATGHAATNDNSDASYVSLGHNSGQPQSEFRATFGTVALPAGSQLRSLTPRVRRQNYSVRSDFLRVILAGAVHVDEVLATDNGSAVWSTLTMASRTTYPNGSSLDQAALDGLELHILKHPDNTTAAQPTRLAELYVDGVYNERPVVTVTAPAEGGTVTNDSQPTVSWTYSDPEGDTQERLRVKVFSAAQYGAGGFDPDTSTATWDSGEMFTSATSLEIGAQLANATYRAYVKAADAGSSGRYSAWDYNQFTINLSPPPDPTITATVQAAQARTKVDVTAAAGAPSTEFVMVEYSDDAGGSWATLRGGEKTTLAPSATLTVYDYEAPPGASRRYRARAGRAVA